MQIAAVISSFAVFVIFFAIVFGVPQMIAMAYMSKQYAKAVSAWYQRTNPGDPMPTFNKDGDDE